jgi:hypothetical protein
VRRKSASFEERFEIGKGGDRKVLVDALNFDRSGLVSIGEKYRDQLIINLANILSRPGQ